MIQNNGQLFDWDETYFFTDSEVSAAMAALKLKFKNDEWGRRLIKRANAVGKNFDTDSFDKPLFDLPDGYDWG